MFLRASLFFACCFALFASAAVAQQYAMTASYTPVPTPVSTAAPAPAATVLMPAFDGGLDVLRTRLAEQLVYPEIAQANGIEGTVVARVRIDESGRPKVVEIVKSLSADCDAAATHTIESLDGFVPARMNGTPFARSIKLEVKFRL